MHYTSTCQSPFGTLTMACDSIGLTGLWLDGQKHFAATLAAEHEEKSLPVFDATRRWLYLYFNGEEPDFTPPLHLTGSPFRIAVWDILKKIPYGKTVSYGEIAQAIARQQGLCRMSAQAVGGAVGHNPVSIIIPCHRVVGSSGSLTGYAGGIERKIKLLELEHTDMRRLFIPAKCRSLRLPSAGGNTP